MWNNECPNFAALRLGACYVGETTCTRKIANQKIDGPHLDLRNVPIIDLNFIDTVIAAIAGRNQSISPRRPYQDITQLNFVSSKSAAGRALRLASIAFS